MGPSFPASTALLGLLSLVTACTGSSRAGEEVRRFTSPDGRHAVIVRFGPSSGRPMRRGRPGTAPGSSSS